MGSTGDRVAARERGWQKATRAAGTAVRERESAARRFAAARAQRDAAEQVMAAELERLSTSEGSVPRAAELVGVELVEAERLMSARRIVRAVPESDDSTSS
ncbi:MULTISPECIES: hypothetical protein [Nocardiaceae]|jgi:hypothetical protein|uniref:hypothetical protein n=1 Tax=Nocardiaceae TaxID=85025 RepID=UPI00050CA6BE|nr:MULTISPECIES: hypothetical protein [Rhodococcus]AMY56494.1 hypothetical protein A3L23_05196 [Rhodococcus fascians D188]